MLLSVQLLLIFFPQHQELLVYILWVFICFLLFTSFSPRFLYFNLQRSYLLLHLCTLFSQPSHFWIHLGLVLDGLVLNLFVLGFQGKLFLYLMVLLLEVTWLKRIKILIVMFRNELILMLLRIYFWLDEVVEFWQDFFRLLGLNLLLHCNYFQVTYGYIPTILLL